MIALAVIATTAVTVYTRSGDTLSQLYSMERRTLAHWVAENEIARLRLERIDDQEPIRIGRSSQRVTLGERIWLVETETKQTSHPLLRRVNLSVYAIDNDEAVGPIDSMTSFIGRY